MKKQARHPLYSAKSCQRWRKYTFLNAQARQHLYKEAYNIKPGVKGSWNLQHLALWWKMFWASGTFSVKMWDGRISETSSPFYCGGRCNDLYMLQCLHTKAFNIKTGVEGSWSFQIFELRRKMPLASGAFNFKFWSERISGTFSF